MIARSAASAGDRFATVYALVRSVAARRLLASHCKPLFGVSDAIDECCCIAWHKHWPRLMQRGWPAPSAAIFAASDAVRDYCRGQRFTEAPDSAPEFTLADCESAVHALPIWLQPTARLLVAGLSTAEIAQRTGVTIRSVQRRKHDIAQALR